LSRDPLHTESFAPSFGPCVNVYVCTRHHTPIGDEANQFSVAPTVNRTSRQADLYGVAMDSDTLSTRGSGLDMYGQERPALTVPCNDRKEIHETRWI